MIENYTLIVLKKNTMNFLIIMFKLMILKCSISTTWWFQIILIKQFHRRLIISFYLKYLVKSVHFSQIWPLYQMSLSYFKINYFHLLFLTYLNLWQEYSKWISSNSNFKWKILKSNLTLFSLRIQNLSSFASSFLCWSNSFLI